jgi:hypothetical protein
MLTSDGGCYNNYNHDHTQYFHQATVSHNGLLIYNPSLAKTQHGWYSGGQKKLGEPYNFESWMGSEFNTGTASSAKTGYFKAKIRALRRAAAGKAAAGEHNSPEAVLLKQICEVFPYDGNETV